MATSGIDLSTEQALDLWKITESNYAWRGKFEVLQERHDYPIVNQLFQEGKVQFQGGTQIIYDVMIDDAGTAEMILPNADHEYAVGNVMAQIVIPWRIIRDYYLTNDQEVMRNAGGRKLVDLLKVRRTSSAYSTANKLEARAFLTPADSDDKVNPYGMPYWVVPITSAQVTAGTSGHQGQNPLYGDGNDIGTCGGVDASDPKYALWRNYNDVWTNANGELTEDDVDKILGMTLDTKFKPPLNAKDVESGAFDNFRYYTNKVMTLAFWRKGRENNDNLGADIGTYAGNVVIRGNPIIRQDDLDSDTSNPLYAINLSSFKPFILDGDFFRTVGPDKDLRHPRTFATNVYTTFNFMCINRRHQGMISYVAAG